MKPTLPQPMREIFIEKLVLSVSSPAEKIDKGFRLLKVIAEAQPVKRTSKKRIPALGVRPGLEIGAQVTLRDPAKIHHFLRRLLDAVDSKLKAKQISENTFSFGIKEYIEVEGVEYQRDIGIIGFDVTVSFARRGKRVTRRKHKRSKLPRKQQVSKEEITEYLRSNFNVSFEGGEYDGE